MECTVKGFDEIACGRETKYENLLDESTYTVTQAKFYERAYMMNQLNIRRGTNLIWR